MDRLLPLGEHAWVFDGQGIGHMSVVNLDEIRNARSFADIHRGISELLYVHRIDHFLFLFFRPNANDAMDAQAVTNIEEPHVLPVLQGMRDGDQRFEVLKFAFTEPRPYVWSEFDNPSVPNPVRFFAGGEIDRTPSDYAVLGLHGARGHKTFLSLATRTGKIADTSGAELLVALGGVLPSVARKLDTGEVVEADGLTERELESLFWLLRGKSAWETAKILGVTERTVNFHVENARKKSGSANRSHLAARILRGEICLYLPEVFFDRIVMWTTATTDGILDLYGAGRSFS